MNARGLLALFALTAFGCGNEDPSLGIDPGSADSGEQPAYAELHSELTNGATDYYHCYVLGNCSSPSLTGSTRCVSGRDYETTVRTRTTDVVVLSFHGGRIEPLSSELARAVSDHFGYSSYDFSAHGSASCLGTLNDFERFHITATNFDDPKAIDLVARHKKALSIHGYSPDRGNYRGTICVGGSNQEQVQAFIASVKQNRSRFSLYTLRAVDAATATPTTGIDCSGIVGSARANLVNRTADVDGGLQLEMSNEIKADLLSSESRYSSLRSVFYGAIGAAMSQ